MPFKVLMVNGTLGCWTFPNCLYNANAGKFEFNNGKQIPYRNTIVRDGSRELKMLLSI